MRQLLGISLILWACMACGSASSRAEDGSEDRVLVEAFKAEEDVFMEFYFEALKQKALENYDMAIIALKRCLEIDDSEAAVYHELGKIHNLQGNYGSAVIYLEQARMLVPQNQSVLVDLYKAHFLDRRFEEALEVVQELSQLDVNYKEDLANLYFLNEQFDQALEILDHLDQQWGYNEMRTGLRRQIYALTDNFEGKIADMKKRIREEPQEERHYLNLIFIYSEADKPELAYDTAHQLLEKDPTSELVHLALYKFYLAENHFDKATESIKRLLVGRELEQEVKYQVLNDLLLHVEDHPEMKNRLREVVKVFAEEQSTIQVYEEVGDFYLRRNVYNQALDYYLKSLEEKISSPDLVIKALLLQIELGAYKEAIGLSNRGLERFPTHPFLYLVQGTALNGAGNHEQALERLQEGLAHLDRDLELEVAFYEQMVVATRALGAVEEAAGFARNVAKLKLKILDE